LNTLLPNIGGLNHLKNAKNRFSRFFDKEEKNSHICIENELKTMKTRYKSMKKLKNHILTLELEKIARNGQKLTENDQNNRF
jgi:hypothetical protein